MPAASRAAARLPWPIRRGSAVTLSIGANNAATTCSGALSGAGGLTVTGGNLFLKAYNTFTGLTTISSGTLTAAQADASGNNAQGTFSVSGSGITIGPGGTLVASQGGGIFGHATPGTGTTSTWPMITVSGLMIDTAGANVNLGPLTLSGGTMAAVGAGDGWGTWNINNNVTVTQNSLISAAAFDLGGNQTSGMRTFTVNPSATLNVSGYFRDAGNPGGTSFGIILNGGGTMVLGGADTYTGATDINSGILSLANSAALSGGGNITFGGGTLQFSPGNTVDYSTRIKNSTAAIAIDTNGQNATFAGAIAGSNSAGLTKLGGGMLTLAGSNAYTGGTTINGGVLSIAGTYSLPGWNATGGYSVAGGAALAVGDAVTDSNITAILGTGNFAAGAGLGFDTTAGARTYAGVIADTGSGSLALHKVGANTLTLTGANTYSGGTTVNAGVLEAATTAALPNYNVAGKVFVAGGATLAVPVGGAGQWNSGASDDIGALLAANSGNFSSGSMLGLDTTGGNFTYAGCIAGSMGLNKLGPNTLSLTGSSAYNGGTTVSAGMLDAATTAALPNYNVAGKVAVGGGATLTVAVGGAGQWNSGANNDLGNLLAANSGNFAAGSMLGIDTTGGNFTYNGLIGGAMGLTKLGANTLSLSGANTYSGGTTVAGGVLQITDAAWNGVNQALPGAGYTLAGGTLSLSYGANWGVTNAMTLTANSTVYIPAGDQTNMNGAISGAGKTFTKDGPGVLFLNTASVNLGAVYVAAGILGADGNSGGGANWGGSGTTVTVGSGGQLGPWDNITVPNPIVLNGGTGIAYNGSFAPGDAAIFSGPVTLNATTSVDTTKGNITLSAAVSGSGGLTAVGGTLILSSSNNTYSGDTRVATGTLQLNNALALQDSTVNMNGSDSGTLNLNGLSAVLGGLKGSGNLTIPAGQTLTVGGNGVNTTYLGVLGGGNAASALTKAGSGVLTLAGSNTCTGGTTVSNGTLQFGNGASNNGLVSGDISVQNNAVLAFANPNPQYYTGVISGSGSLVKTGAGLLALDSTAANTFTGGTTINAGVLQMGNSAALGNPSLSLNLAVNSGGTLDLNGNSPTFAVLSGNGVIANSNTGSSYAIFNYDNSTTSSIFGGSIRDSLSGGTQTVGLVVGSGTLTLTGSNAYSHKTEVDSELLLGPNGSLGNTLVSVIGGGTFGTALNASGGTSTIGGPLKLAGGSTLDLASDMVTNTLQATAGTLAGANLRFERLQHGRGRAFFQRRRCRRQHQYDWHHGARIDPVRGQLYAHFRHKRAEQRLRIVVQFRQPQRHALLFLASQLHGVGGSTHGKLDSARHRPQRVEGGPERELKRHRQLGNGHGAQRGRGGGRAQCFHHRRGDGHARRAGDTRYASVRQFIRRQYGLHAKRQRYQHVDLGQQRQRVGGERKRRRACDFRRDYPGRQSGHRAGDKLDAHAQRHHQRRHRFVADHERRRHADSRRHEQHLRRRHDRRCGHAVRQQFRRPGRRDELDHRRRRDVHLRSHADRGAAARRLVACGFAHCARTGAGNGRALAGGPWSMVRAPCAPPSSPPSPAEGPWSAVIYCRFPPRSKTAVNLTLQRSLNPWHPSKRP